MLATKISFINEMANLAEHLGADIEMVRRGIGSDPRIGYDFIYPGCGFGGSCFPKDLQALRRTAEAEGFDPLLLGAVEAVNQRQKSRLFSKIQRHYPDGLHGKVFAVWGYRSNPTPMTSAKPPAWCCSKPCGAPAPACRPTTRKPWKRSSGSTAPAPT